MEDRQVIPEFAVSRLSRLAADLAARGAASADPATVIAAAPQEAAERYIEILRIPDGTLVSVLELSSPTNKTDSRGRAAYLEKQRSILASDVHLIEIDLLRFGPHWASVPESLTARHRPYDYLVCVSRGSDRTLFECYFRSVREPLPSIAVPLQTGEDDAVLELQTAFDRAYDQGRLAARVGYDQPPSPPLRPEDQEWADRLLKDRGLLPAR
jgi:hypothetical protein